MEIQVISIWIYTTNTMYRRIAPKPDTVLLQLMSKKAALVIGLIPGDGIGKEVIPAARRVMEALLHVGLWIYKQDTNCLSRLEQVYQQKL